jgi:D-alanyl-D-alanine carboxypeptidase
VLAFPLRQKIDTGNPGRTGKGTSDVASLLGRFIRTVIIVFAAFAVLVTSPVQAAPFAAIVIDARTGETLYEKNADARLNPASLTKMMTLYITFQEIEAGRLSLDTMVTVTKNAAAQPPSRLGLKPGQKIAIRYLIRAAAVKSANDAAAALGDHIGGDQAAFAKRMTRTAKQLGMTNTTFRNANGLTADGHLSSARDMTMLGRHLFYDFPQYYNIFSRRTADAGMATVRNTNSRFLDSYEGADGIKTGYTSAAGFNLTASAQRGNKRIIATVFGGTSTAARNAKMAELMDIGFGAAKNKVREQPPEAPALPDDALVASAKAETTPDIDDLDAEGGSAKTVRVSGEVKVSVRPKARPVVQGVPDDMAIAMAAGIAGALAEATAEPAPEGTLDFQAEAIATAPEADVIMPDDAVIAAVEPETLPEVVPEAVADAAPAGTLEAQAVALASGGAPAETPALAETAVAALLPDPTLAGLKPKARPETVLAALAPAELVVAALESPLETLPEVIAEPAPEVIAEVVVPELVVTDTGDGETLLAATTPAMDGPLPEVTDVETVAGAIAIAPRAEVTAAATIAAPRKAPIFDAVEVAAVEPVAEEQEVVVVMSTSGGRHFGVNVGDFPSRYDAERALLKTALAESATLNDGLRKITQKGGTWHANFMGLTEDQANLACRRLKARAVPCETLGG